MKNLLLFLFALIPYTVIGEVIVPMEKQENGLYLIPCSVNGVPMKFIFDTGASSVNISLTEARFLLKNGYIQESDIKGTSHAQIANGDIVENTRILLNKIEIGGIELNDVEAAVSHNLNAPLLLGQSAISKLGTIQLEGTNLIIKDAKGQNFSKSDVFQLGIIALIVAIVCSFFYFVFSTLKKSNHTIKTNVLNSTLSKNNNHLKIRSILIWLKYRKSVLYIAYCFMLLLSALTIELHIKNKRDNLYNELKENLNNTFDPIDNCTEALDFNRIDELEYEEVSISKLFKDNNVAKREKRGQKQWNNMFSGIEHVYKITDGGWQMTGMLSTLIHNKDLNGLRYGIQDYNYFPFMICVPIGLDFNDEIARNIIEKSLDKVYCKPDQYNTAFRIKTERNEYYELRGHIHIFEQESEPNFWKIFYDETTGSDPIYDSNKFTGYYWFGMHKIGQYRVIYAYGIGCGWLIEEKDGFNASTKDRVIYHGIAFISLTIILFLILYWVRISNKSVIQI